MSPSTSLKWGAACATACLAWGCATAGGAWSRGTAQFADTLALGLSAMEAGRFEEANTRLRWLAARCEAGPAGRHSVLLLATTALDPRNPEAAPDEAARLAARFMGLPDSDPVERALAETVLLLALDRGAGIPSQPVASEIVGSEPVRGVATRFDDCGPEDTPVVGPLAAPIPSYPGTPTFETVSRLRIARDSLTARVEALEAELERIRSLLQGGVPPDTSGPNGP